MHLFKGFTAEEMAALSPWRLPPVGARAEDPFAEVTKEAVDIPPALTVEEIEAMQRQAHDEAMRDAQRQGYDNGYREGREQGYHDGQAEGRGAADQLAAQVNRLLEALAEPFAELDQQVEQELLTLVITIARQLIRRELKTDPGQIVAVVREAMVILPSSSRKISLHLHPEDAVLIRSTLLLEDAAERWKIVEDPLLTRGGCRVSTETSRIDATVEKKLAAVIARVLGGERKKDAHDGDPTLA